MPPERQRGHLAARIRFGAMTAKRLLAVGGAHPDRRGRVAGAYVPASSNPGAMREDVGGGAFNAARAAAQRGTAVSLLSLRGGDAAGETVAKAIAAARLADLSVTFLDRTTPSYTAILDGHGELIAGLADMQLYEAGFAKQLGRRAFRDAAVVADGMLVDANLPAPALERAARRSAGRLFAIAVSASKVSRLRSILGRLDFLFMNRAEAAALLGDRDDSRIEPSELAAELRGLGLKGAVVTAGAAPMLAWSGERVLRLDVPSSPDVVDVTGAGDALAGAMVSALLVGIPFAAALREGAAAARLAVASPSAAPKLGEAAFARALSAIPDPVAF